jgi:hypothetical protein
MPEVPAMLPVLLKRRPLLLGQHVLEHAQLGGAAKAVRARVLKRNFKINIRASHNS